MRYHRDTVTHRSNDRYRYRVKRDRMDSMISIPVEIRATSISDELRNAGPGQVRARFRHVLNGEGSWPKMILRTACRARPPPCPRRRASPFYI